MIQMTNEDVTPMTPHDPMTPMTPMTDRQRRRWIQVSVLVVMVMLAMLIVRSAREILRGVRTQDECAWLCGEIVTRISDKLLGNDNTIKLEALLRIEREIESTRQGLIRRNANGRIIDSWDSPLDIRHENRGKGLLVVVRSAGYDRTFMTVDDIENSSLYDGIKMVQ
jgi:hypothetical protein